MAGSIFESIRRLPGYLSIRKKKTEASEIVGNNLKLNLCSEFGFPSNPACVAYDAVLDLLAIATKEGSLYIYGKPGVFLQANLKSNAEIIRVYFLSGSFKLLVLTGSDDLHLFEISKDSQAKLEEIDHIENIAVHMSEDGAAHSDFGLITALALTYDLVSVLIGTELGSVLVINFDSFNDPRSYRRIENKQIARKITGQIGERIKSPVVAVLDRPGHRNHILIGFSSGSCVVYDCHTRCTVAVLPGLQGLKSVCWCGGSGYPSKPDITAATPPSDLGNRLLASFSDGSLGTWKLDHITSSSSTDQPVVVKMEEAPTMPYGPFPCLAIDSIFWLSSNTGGITVFVGGMPKAGFQDKNTVTMLRGSNIDRATMAQVATAHRLAVESAEGDDSDAFSGMMSMSANLPPVHVFDSAAPERVCFDLPSKLVHICAIGPAHGPYKALLLLCEEELIAVDLISPDWPTMTLPYLGCLHTSTIKTHSLVTGVKPLFMQELEENWHFANLWRPSIYDCSDRPWPIQGGDCLATDSEQQLTDDLLLLGHEDGSVAFWRLGKSGSMQCIHRLHTSRIFDGEFGPYDVSQETDSWPPFRRIGLFDPYMDEYRGLVTCLRLVGETLLVGGAAGQVTVWQLMKRGRRHLPVHELTLKKELAGSKWRGNDALPVKQTLPHEEKPGLHPLCVIQVKPPCRITSLSCADIPSKSGSSITNILVAIGTPLGFGMVNVSTADSLTTESAVVFRTCTLPQNPEALNEASVGDGWARRRTRDLKKSLRDSFRRLKRMRSTVNRAPHPLAPPTTTGAPINRIASTSRSRVGLQSSATQSKSMMQGSMLGPGGSTVVYDEAAPNLNDLARGTMPSGEPPMLPPTGVEREITDRPSDTMETAVIRACTFSPVHFRSRVDVPGVCIGSVLFGTAGGVVRSCSIYAKARDPESLGFDIHVQPAKELIIQHKAPVLNLRVLEPKSASPLPTSALNCPWQRPASKSASSLISDSSSQPLLLVWTEEQVRSYSLPTFSLKHKIRITAKDGSKIQSGTVAAFPASPAHPKNVSGTFGCVFSNSFGQAGLLDLPSLRAKDRIPMLNVVDVVAVSSVTFAESALSLQSAGAEVTKEQLWPHLAPAVGLYQIGSGQFTLFDLVHPREDRSYFGAAYKCLCRVRLPENRCMHNLAVAQAQLGNHNSQKSLTAYSQSTSGVFSASSPNNNSSSISRMPWQRSDDDPEAFSNSFVSDDSVHSMPGSTRGPLDHVSGFSNGRPRVNCSQRSPRPVASTPRTSASVKRDLTTRVEPTINSTSPQFDWSS